MGSNTTIRAFLAELWAFKHRRHFILSFHHRSPHPPTLVTMAMAYVRIMRACQTPTFLTQGGERMGDYVEGPFGHTQTYPLCTAQVALENRATVFLILYLQRLSLMSHSGGIH
jgi:hypothetical protein